MGGGERERERARERAREREREREDMCACVRVYQTVPEDTHPCGSFLNNSPQNAINVQ